MSAMKGWSRRRLLRAGAGSVLSAPLLLRAFQRNALAAQTARRVIFFYYPDGVIRSEWHATGSEHAFTLSPQQAPLHRHQADCVFLKGLGMGPADAGSHPGGAKKLLTSVDGGAGMSLDFWLGANVYSDAPHRHLYLGAQANQNNASGDKHISYPAAGTTVAPEDSPMRAFSRLFGGPPPAEAGPDLEATVIDGMLEDLMAFRSRLGRAEATKLDHHLESLREVERRIKSAEPRPSCTNPGVGVDTVSESDLYQPERFPEVLDLQQELMVEAMACGLSRVGVLQASHHTSELIMSRFPGTDLTSSRDMRSHEASHYGGSQERVDVYRAQRRWFVSKFARLLDLLKSKPEGDSNMLDYSLVVLVTEVADGDDHQHDDMPFVLAGRAGGAINPGRFLDYGHRRHADLLLTVAQAAGARLTGFGHGGSGPLPGVLA